MLFRSYDDRLPFLNPTFPPVNVEMTSPFGRVSVAIVFLFVAWTCMKYVGFVRPGVSKGRKGGFSRRNGFAVGGLGAGYASLEARGGGSSGLICGSSGSAVMTPSTIRVGLVFLSAAATKSRKAFVSSFAAGGCDEDELKATPSARDGCIRRGSLEYLSNDMVRGTCARTSAIARRDAEGEMDVEVESESALWDAKRSRMIGSSARTLPRPAPRGATRTHAAHCSDHSTSSPHSRPRRSHGWRKFRA